MLHYQFILTFLPPLPETGGIPPITFREILDKVRAEECQPAEQLVMCMLCEEELFEILRLRFKKSMSAGHSNSAPVSTTDNTETPDCIFDSLKAILATDSSDVSEEEFYDSLWRTYFAELVKIGKNCRSPLMNSFADWESNLRESLAIARKTGVVQDDEFKSVISEWHNSPDPMTAEKALDSARWNFIQSNHEHYAFSADEFTAYLLKLRSINRYHRLDSKRGREILQEVASL
ncbi:MAG: DUF2764 family protein [Candidatus Riflebacteria bacterium]|nr:DUF2764 family protein [Candidatus Riflebacteria bacterium]